MQIDGLFVRHRAGQGQSVLFVHGATFPSALSVDYRIDGWSWMDDLAGRGLDVWAFDFAGYGGSARPGTLGRAEEAAGQIERVAAFIDRPLHLLVHSWGSLPAGVVAARQPAWLQRLVLFGPIAARNRPKGPPSAATTVTVTAEDQWHAFQVDGRPSPIDPAVFSAWAEAYRGGEVVPAGPQLDIADAWAGRLPYDPRTIVAPTLLVRGEWDEVSSADDLANLHAQMRSATVLHLPRGAHRMHLETNRQALFDAVGDFLLTE